MSVCSLMTMSVVSAFGLETREAIAVESVSTMTLCEGGGRGGKVAKVGLYGLPAHTWRISDGDPPLPLPYVQVLVHTTYPSSTSYFYSEGTRRAWSSSCPFVLDLAGSLRVACGARFPIRGRCIA